eukprot:scaffold155138_cov15-Prasinocladus_malaysianus.AAC.1
MDIGAKAARMPKRHTGRQSSGPFSHTQWVIHSTMRPSTRCPLEKHYDTENFYLLKLCRHVGGQSLAEFNRRIAVQQVSDRNSWSHEAQAQATSKLEDPFLG